MHHGSRLLFLLAVIFISAFLFACRLIDNTTCRSVSHHTRDSHIDNEKFIDLNSIPDISKEQQVLFKKRIDDIYKKERHQQPLRLIREESSRT